MVHIAGEIVIDRAPDEVFDFVADERNEPGFNPRMLRAEQVSEGPIGLGTRFRAETVMGPGRTAEMVIEYTAYDRPHRLASSTRLASMEIRGALTFVPDGGGTRMRWSWELQPRGALRLLGPVLALVGRRQERQIWTSLKHLLEAGDGVVGPREIAKDVFFLEVRRGMTRSNVYFVRSGESWVLIDSGSVGRGPVIERAAGSLFGSGSRPTAILLTHSHPDHAGSARVLATRWQCPVYVHQDELPLTSADLVAYRAFADPLNRWLILPVMRLMPRERVRKMLENADLRDAVRSLPASGEVPGLPGWRSIHTPGHTPGHVSFFRVTDHVLLTGDAILTTSVNSMLGLLLKRRELSGPLRLTTWRWAAAKESAAVLARLEPSVLATGHGEPLAGPRTPAEVDALIERFTAPPRL